MENGKWDYKTILVVLAVGIVFVGWQKYLERKYPDYYKSKIDKAESISLEDQKGGEGQSEISDTGNMSDSPIQVGQMLDESQGGEIVLSNNESLTKIWINSDQWSAKINPLGMAIEEVVDSQYTDRNGKAIDYTENGYLLQLLEPASKSPLVFKLSHVSAQKVEGLGRFLDGTFIKRSYSISRHGYIEVETAIEKPSPDFRGWVTRSVIARKESNQSFLQPSQDLSSISISVDGSTFEHHIVKEDWSGEWPTVVASSLSSHYFASALLEKSTLKPKLKASATNKLVILDAEYALPALGEVAREIMSQKLYIGPKLAERLELVDPVLVGIIDFGFFSSIGGVLLKLLKTFHEWTGNWGWAILVLTLFVRILVLPFNIMSYRSMKKMQLIQPKLQALRERYKDDPVAMNRETMELMKKEKVNPLGGCLPMLLQMPVFFALYQVLSHAIELYQAPFILWIHDLSAKDPYYVLPALMGITLWVQHKLTPTTLDPAQAKIMGFMPILFTLFTLGLPSGLTFYIFVSTLFGVIQQKLFMNTHLKPSA
jgi:YidC/Oxa1 family membrane protein insertase